MKRNPALKALSIDHHHGLVLARKARMAATAGDPQNTEQQKIWAELRAHAHHTLMHHFDIEESYIAAKLKILNDPHANQLADRLYREHETLRGLLAPDSAQTATNLKQLGELLTQHIRFEERELFEIAQMKLDENALLAIAAASTLST